MSVVGIQTQYTNHVDALGRKMKPRVRDKYPKSIRQLVLSTFQILLPTHPKMIIVIVTIVTDTSVGLCRDIDLLRCAL